MRTLDQPTLTRSLADLAPGESVRIQNIYFDQVRGLCSKLGITEGTRLRCRARTANELLLQLETDSTRFTTAHVSWARFVAVEPEPAAVAAAPA